MKLTALLLLLSMVIGGCTDIHKDTILRCVTIRGFDKHYSEYLFKQSGILPDQLEIIDSTGKWNIGDTLILTKPAQGKSDESK
jgi:hypothetical protein